MPNGEMPVSSIRPRSVQMVNVDVADSAASPATDARYSGVKASRGEGQERRHKHQEQRLASGESETVELARS